MGVTYNVAYVVKPPTWADAARLLEEIEADERRLDSLPISELWRHDDMLRRLREKVNYGMDLVGELEARDNGL